MTNEEKYCLSQFEKWWKRKQKDRMMHSKYLARKAWVFAWFQRMHLTGPSKY